MSDIRSASGDSARRRCTLYPALLMCAVSPLAIGFPLTTEDTGTLGQARSKIELTTERGEERENGSREVSLTQEFSIAHGLLENLNGTFSLPYRDVRSQEVDASRTRVGGVGDVKFGLKWRYFAHDDLSLGFKLGVTAPSANAAEKLGSGKSTQAIDVIASYKTAPWELHLNLGFTRNGNTRNQRESLARVSAALVRRLDSRWKVMADIGVASDKSRHANQALAYFGAGLSFAMSQQLSLEVGVKRGLTSAETDLTGLAGLSLRF